jgi:para-nitrobenzyl esterase
MYTGPISTPTDYVKAIDQLAAGTTVGPDVLATYPLADYSSPRNALIAVLTDANLVCPTRRMARALALWEDEPVWRAAFVHTNSNGPSHGFGPAHVMDLGYWFDTLWQMPSFTPNADEVALAQTMPRYLATFARTGNPNFAGAPVVWPRYFGTSDQHLAIDIPLEIGSGFHADKCDFWDSHLPPAGWIPDPWKGPRR